MVLKTVHKVTANRSRRPCFRLPLHTGKPIYLLFTGVMEWKKECPSSLHAASPARNRIKHQNYIIRRRLTLQPDALQLAAQKPGFNSVIRSFLPAVLRGLTIIRKGEGNYCQTGEMLTWYKGDLSNPSCFDCLISMCRWILMLFVCKHQCNWFSK